MTPDQEHEIGRCLYREANDAFFILGARELRVLEANPAAQRLTGLRRKQLQKLTLGQLFAASESALAELIRACQSTGHYKCTSDYSLGTEGGERRAVDVSVSRIHVEPEPLALLVVRDVSWRKKAEEVLRESEERFGHLVETIDQVFWLVAYDPPRVLYVSPAFERITGYPVGELYRDAKFWGRQIHPEDQPRARGVFRAWSQGPQPGFEVEYRIVCRDGSARWVLDQGVAVRDAQGKLLRASGMAKDITEHKRLEEQLRQAQKMEAVGRLAGGVAHDFNNLLMVINGYSALLLRDIEDHSPWREFVLEIQKAGDRAAALTKQLLAFSRKLLLRPRALDLNQLASSVAAMLRRLIGEDIELRLDLAPQLGLVLADPGQLEMVLVNLAVNARDAMPRGGKLTLATAEVVLGADEVRDRPELRPGPYMVLTVTDTGQGMDEETLARAFEPYFTTKEVGKGTGLGLATAYGVVQQSGGHITVASTLGRGTTFSVYLPRAEAPAVPSEGAADGPGLPQGKETVLLVEDEDGVRSLARRVLEQSGYHVLEASHGHEALAVCEQHSGPIHLVLTDVVMPEMGGPELVRRLEARHPELKVLYMSGYADSTLLRRGVSQEEARLLQKPFSLADLVRKVRGLLDGDAE